MGKLPLDAFSQKDLGTAVNVWLTLRQGGFGMSKLYEALNWRNAPLPGRARSRKAVSPEERIQRKKARLARFAKTNWGIQKG